MKIEPEDIRSFQGLWNEQFQSQLSQEEAQEKAICLIELMKTIYRPIPKPQNFGATKQISILDYNQGNS